MDGSSDCVHDGCFASGGPAGLIAASAAASCMCRDRTLIGAGRPMAMTEGFGRGPESNITRKYCSVETDQIRSVDQ